MRFLQYNFRGICITYANLIRKNLFYNIKSQKITKKTNNMFHL